MKTAATRAARFHGSTIGHFAVISLELSAIGRVSPHNASRRPYRTASLPWRLSRAAAVGSARQVVGAHPAALAVLTLDGVVNLLAVDRDRRRRVDAQPHLVAA